MRLAELSPLWITRDARRIGVSFDAPGVERKSADLDYRVYAYFDVAIGGIGGSERGHHRTGETFDDLTLSPSILCSQDAGEGGSCSWSWHGFITDGEVSTC